MRFAYPFLFSTLLAFGAEPPGPPLDLALQRFSRALTFRTVSPGTDQSEFTRFRTFLRTAFPTVHRHLDCWVIGRSSLLYRWPGSNPSLKPIVLLAHQDVVAGEGSWQHPPFSGEIADGFVWGRGARDFKPGLMAILESAEWLLQQDFVPKRDFYFAFGADEETQGYEGAGLIAQHLAAAQVQAEFILDEGGGVVSDTIGGIDPARPVAVIGVAEKGYLSLDLVAEGPGGHSATAGQNNPILILGEALQKIEAKPFPAALQEPVPAMLRQLGQGMGFWKRFLFSNLWLTGGITKRFMEGNPDSEAMLRTTVAITRFESGVQDNVIPGRASAVANVRLLPGWTITRVTQRLAEIIGDPRVKITVRGRAFEAPPMAPMDTPSYGFLSSVILRTFPGALIAPSITTGATDIRHYAPLSRNLYRFAPSMSTRTFSGNGHRPDERLPVDNYRQYLAFYTTFLREGARAFPSVEKR